MNKKYNEITGEFEKIGSGQIEVGAIVDTLPIGEKFILYESISNYDNIR